MTIETGKIVPRFDPDRLPNIDVHKERRGPRPMAWDRDKQATRLLLNNMLAHEGEIKQTQQRIIKIANRVKYDRLPYASVIGTPIDVETESLHDILQTITSLGESTRKVPGPHLLVVDLNYTGDERREEDRLQRNHERSLVIADAIADALEEKDIEVVVAEDHMPAGTTITQVRNRLLKTAAGYMWSRVGGIDKSRDYFIHNVPFVMIDGGDTVVAEDALSTTIDRLNDDMSVFVNGRVRFTGGVMALSPEELQERDTNSKLIYLVEILRREMFEHLPPETSRGYLPETWLAAKIGVLINLGAFNERSAENESYFAQFAAIEALRKQYGTKKPADEATPAITYADPYISKTVAGRIESLVRYESFAVNTANRSIESMVHKYGRGALIGFDQGLEYEMFTRSTRGSEGRQESEWERVQTFPFLDAVYSYFRDCGGEMRMEDLRACNNLLKTLFPPSEDALFTLDSLRDDSSFWIPEYVEKARRERMKAELVRA